MREYRLVDDRFPSGSRTRVTKVIILVEEQTFKVWWGTTNNETENHERELEESLCHCWPPGGDGHWIKSKSLNKIHDTNHLCVDIYKTIRLSLWWTSSLAPHSVNVPLLCYDILVLCVCVCVCVCVVPHVHLCSPHTTVYLSTYYYVCVLILCMCICVCDVPHASLHSPHTTMYVSSHYCVCPHTTWSF